MSASLRRQVSPRQGQYSHLLDETIGCGDIVLLDPLTEDNLIENVRKRYNSGEIYVSRDSVYKIHICTIACSLIK